MAQKPAIHGRDHRPVGANAPTDLGGADPLDWLPAYVASVIPDPVYVPPPTARIKILASAADNYGGFTSRGVSYQNSRWTISSGDVVYDTLGVVAPSAVAVGSLAASAVDVPDGFYRIDACAIGYFPAQTVERRFGLNAGPGTSSFYLFENDALHFLPLDDGSASATGVAPGSVCVNVVSDWLQFWWFEDDTGTPGELATAMDLFVVITRLGDAM